MIVSEQYILSNRAINGKNHSTLVEKTVDLGMNLDFLQKNFEHEARSMFSIR
jgi:hypothetical protein